MSKPMPFTVINAGASDSQVELHDPTLLPKSAGFLWNKKNDDSNELSWLCGCTIYAARAG